VKRYWNALYISHKAVFLKKYFARKCGYFINLSVLMNAIYFAGRKTCSKILQIS